MSSLNTSTRCLWYRCQFSDPFQTDRELFEHLRAAEGILLQWQFEEPGRSIQIDDPFHQAIILSITIIKNALRDPSNLLNPRLPLEIEVLRRLIDADRYYRQHLNRLQATGQ